MFQSRPQDFERLERCPSCDTGRDRFRVVTDRGDRFDGERAVLCPTCSLVFLDPRLGEDALERYYAGDEFSEEVRGSASPSPEAMRYRDMRAARRWRFIEEALPPHSRSLEVGCGAGNFLRLLAEAGHEPVGIDPSTGYAEHARDRGLAVVAGRFPEDLPGGDPYQVAFLFHVLEHVRDPVGLLSAIRRRLLPSGLFFLEYPDVALAARRRFLPHTYFERAHLYDFTRATVGDALARAGFRVERAYLDDRVKPYDRNVLLLCLCAEPVEVDPRRPSDAERLWTALRRRLRWSAPLMPLRPLWRAVTGRGPGS